MDERDPKRIISQWEREIDDEVRRLRRPRARGGWRIVGWTAVWLLWLAVLAGLLSLFRPLH